MCSVIEIKNSNEYYIHYHSPESLDTSNMDNDQKNDKPDRKDDKNDSNEESNNETNHDDDKDFSVGEIVEKVDTIAPPKDPDKKPDEVTSDKGSSLEGDCSSICKTSEISESSQVPSNSDSGNHQSNVPITVNSHIPTIPSWKPKEVNNEKRESPEKQDQPQDTEDVKTSTSEMGTQVEEKDDKKDETNPEKDPVEQEEPIVPVKKEKKKPSRSRIPIAKIKSKSLSNLDKDALEKARKDFKKEEKLMRKESKKLKKEEEKKEKEERKKKKEEQKCLKQEEKKSKINQNKENNGGENKKRFRLVSRKNSSNKKDNHNSGNKSETEDTEGDTVKQKQRERSFSPKKFEFERTEEVRKVARGTEVIRAVKTNKGFIIVSGKGQITKTIENSATNNALEKKGRPYKMII